MDYSKAFSAENGIIIDEVNSGPFYTGGTSSPVGLDLPVETFYCQNTSTGIVVWRKYSTGVNDWSRQQNLDFMQKAVDTSETSTTSTTTFLNKLTITTPSLPLGDYELQFMYRWRNLAANRRQGTRIQRNASDVLLWESFNSNTAERSLQSGIIHFNSISGVQTITLGFKVVGSGTTTYMSDAYMKFQRLT